MPLSFIPTDLPEVVLIRPQVFGDERGLFMETFNQAEFDQAGIQVEFVQDNHSASCKNVLRGLHYQIQQPQGKLVRVISGEVYDVVVDIRRSSPTFGRWIGTVLSAETKEALWIPAGFAHGYFVLSETAEFTYKTTDYYAPQWERIILWNDPDLAIDWPLNSIAAPILSNKDKQGYCFRVAEVYP